MTKRIFRSIFIVSIAVLIACLGIILSMLYSDFTDTQKTQLKVDISYVEQGLTGLGLDYFADLDSGDYRITWIDSDGTVLYDSDVEAATMENHADRQEVIQAKEIGYGESIRESATVLERQVYVAKLLEDDTVLRASSTQATFSAYILMLLQPIIIVLVVVVFLSLFLASRLSRQIVKPLNELDLDQPLNNDTYEEISPLLNRIEKQHRQIQVHIDNLKASKYEFETITNNMSEGMVLINAKGMIISINNSAAQLFNTDQTCIGKDFLTVDRSFTNSGDPP